MAQEGITTQGSAGTTDYMLADDLGSVRDVVNTSSAVDDHIVYNSFGQVAYQSNAAIAHWAGFAGYHTDVNTGLANAGERWYDPSVGRWISEDPLGFSGGDTNVSRYVANDTTNSVDPTGLKKKPGPSFTVNQGSDPSAGAVLGAKLGISEAATGVWGQPYDQVTGTSTPDSANNSHSSSMTLTADSCNTINVPASSSISAATGGLMTMSLINYAPGTYNVKVAWTLLITSTGPTGSGGTAYVTVPGPNGVGTMNILVATCAGPGRSVIIKATTAYTVIIPATGNLATAFIMNPITMRNTGAGVTNYMAKTQLLGVTPAPANQPAGQLPVTTPDPAFPQQGIQGGAFTGKYVPPVEPETDLGVEDDPE